MPPLIPRGTKEAKFPLPLDNYKSIVPSSHPQIEFNEGRDIAWSQCQQKVNNLREKVGMKVEGKEGLFKELFGEESELYARLKERASNH